MKFQQDVEFRFQDSAGRSEERRQLGPLDLAHRVARQLVDHEDALGAFVGRQLLAQGADPSPGSVSDFAALIKREFARYGKIVRESGIRLD